MPWGTVSPGPLSTVPGRCGTWGTTPGVSLPTAAPRSLVLRPAGLELGGYAKPAVGQVRWGTGDRALPAVLLGGRRALGQTALLPWQGRQLPALRHVLRVAGSAVTGRELPTQPRPNQTAPGPIPCLRHRLHTHPTARERGGQGLSMRVGHARASAGARVRATPPPPRLFRSGGAGLGPRVVPGQPPGAWERGNAAASSRTGAPSPAFLGGGVERPQGLWAWEMADVIQTSSGLLPPLPPVIYYCPTTLMQARGARQGRGGGGGCVQGSRRARSDTVYCGSTAPPVWGCWGSRAVCAAAVAELWGR